MLNLLLVHDDYYITGMYDEIMHVWDGYIKSRDGKMRLGIQGNTRELLVEDAMEALDIYNKREKVLDSWAQGVIF